MLTGYQGDQENVGGDTQGKVDQANTGQVGKPGWPLLQKHMKNLQYKLSTDQNKTNAKQT